MAPEEAIPPPAGASTSALVDLVALFARLRRECGWKAAQTHRSLARYLLEETYETLDAIDAGAASGDWSDLREELGDLLLQVYLHAAIAAEAGEFDIEDVAAGLRAKMIRRNPHVFAADGPRETDPDRIDALWQQAKAEEKSARTELMDGVPATLPALLSATKALDRLDRLDRAGAPARIDADGSIGARLLAVVADARAAGVDPEQALRDTVHRLVAD